MRLPEACEHLAQHLAQLSRGSGRRRPGPQLGGHRVPVHPVERGVEMRIPDDAPGRVEGVLEGKRLRRRQDHPAEEEGRNRHGASHLRSALISSGMSKTEGGTLSYSIRVIVITCCMAPTWLRTVVGCISFPNRR